MESWPKEHLKLTGAILIYPCVEVASTGLPSHSAKVSLSRLYLTWLNIIIIVVVVSGMQSYTVIINLLNKNIRNNRLKLFSNLFFCGNIKECGTSDLWIVLNLLSDAWVLVVGVW